MMNQIRRAMSSEKGFTLVELLVVIGIIGILAMMLLPQFRGMRDRARVASCQSNLKNIGTQLESFYADRERYPIGAEWTSDFAGLTIANCPHSKGAYKFTPNPTRDDTVVTKPVFSPPTTLPTVSDRVDSYSVECQFHNGSKAGGVNFPENVQMFVTQAGVERFDQ